MSAASSASLKGMIPCLYPCHRLFTHAVLAVPTTTSFPRHLNTPCLLRARAIASGFCPHTISYCLQQHAVQYRIHSTDIIRVQWCA